MHRDTASSCHKTDDFIPGYRIATLRIANGKIMDAFHNDTGLRLPYNLRFSGKLLNIL